MGSQLLSAAAKPGTRVFLGRKCFTYLLLSRADVTFPFNAKAPRWLKILRSMMVARQIVDVPSLFMAR
jgi:hypothetical protein